MLRPRPVSSPVDASRIVDAAIERIATLGFPSLTLRDLAKAVGKSTTVIVNLFGSKAGLVLAVGEAAFERDRTFHRTFFGTVAGLPAGRDPLLALTQQYLRERAGPQAGFVRVWEALLLDADPSPERQALMQRWEAMRLEAWSGYLGEGPAGAFAAPLTACLAMEQFYAGALGGRADYALIAAEGWGGFMDRMAGAPEARGDATFWYRDQLIMPEAPGAGLEPGSTRLKLLDIAADQILTGGLSAVSNRSVSVVAGTSTSTIAYHWPDMRRFIVDAVWHSVFRDMPRYLAGRRPDIDPAEATLDSWAGIMAPTVAIGPDPEGFYVKYARLIASVCLEARRDPSLADLAMVLRGPEGGGTYYNSTGVWPVRFALGRLAATRFALWIKGRGLTAAATGVPLSGPDLKGAATLLVPQAKSTERTLSAPAAPAPVG